MDLKTDVVIVGAGGGGAVLGLILARYGIDAVIVDQADGPPHGLRGEILQPNGQRILDQLGLLEHLPSHAVRPVRRFHFRSPGGRRLCTIDYDLLPAPYNRALVTWPNVVHQTIVQALEDLRPGWIRYGTSFRRLVKHGESIVGIEAEQHGRPVRIGAKLVVGADGPCSKVREALGIRTALHRYREGYLVAMLTCREGLEEAQYYVGRRTILGIFPGAGHRVYVLYMIPSDALPQLRLEGIDNLRKRWIAIDPAWHRTFATLEDWGQTAFMGTGRVRAKTWVSDRAALIGDAAHGMNPHASQGRMQAMADAVTLADVIRRCAEKEDWSASALAHYERLRRPQVTMLQRLADEEVMFWNTGNPVLAWLRDRVFATIDRNPRLQYQVLSATAGLRQTPPFSWLDRLQAAGLLPDPRAHSLPTDIPAL
ncbi:MAG: FAD-dependent monooxygenase [Nitrospirae bacterium]|nr:MAG: FAD-dependent monooxygenase [Nitrospirota bacterium]